MQKILLALVVFVSLSCQEKDEGSEELQFEVTPLSVDANPDDIRSCSDIAQNSSSASLLAPSAMFNKISYRWTGSEELTITKIELKIKSSFLVGGEYKCSLTEDGLADTLGSAPLVIAGGDKATYIADCKLRCGGIKLLDESRSAFLNGTVRISGETFAGADSVKVFADTPISIVWTP